MSPTKSFVFFACLVLLCGIFVPHGASAHEVYVLNQATIAQDLASNSPNPFGAFWTNQYQFFFWGFVAFVTVTTVFFASVFHAFELRCRPFLLYIKRWAPLVTRLTLGVCLIVGTYYQGLFGPELPLIGFAGQWTGLLQWVLYVIGFLILFGFCTRVAAFVALIIFFLSVLRYGSYMLTYTNYLGEILITLILGGGAWSLDAKRLLRVCDLKQNCAEKNPGGGGRSAKRNGAKGFWKDSFADLIKKLEPYAFPIARVGFGVSIVFAAFYAKFLHSTLALDTIAQYHLTNYFHFDPLFIVLGALIIESLVGLFFILGVEVRWTAIFFLFWLALSLLYFGEAVWPHLILLGLNLAFLLHGYDRYSLEGRFFAHPGREPVL